MELEQVINELIDKKLNEYPKRREVYGIVRKARTVAQEKPSFYTWKCDISFERNRNLFECDPAEMERRASVWSWSPGEDAKLKREVNAALSRIAVNHKRTLGAIKSRIHQVIEKEF